MVQSTKRRVSLSTALAVLCVVMPNVVIAQETPKPLREESRNGNFQLRPSGSNTRTIQAARSAGVFSQNPENRNRAVGLFSQNPENRNRPLRFPQRFLEPDLARPAPGFNPGQNVITFFQDANRGPLGLTLRTVPDVLRAHIDLPEENGLVVDAIAEESPAADAIKVNDILLKAGEVALTASDDLFEAINEAEEDQIAIELLREGKEETVEVPTGREPAEGEQRYLIGVAIAEIDDAVRAQLGVDDQLGIVVTEVKEESPAAAAGLKANDILLEINGDEIDSAETLIELVQEYGADEVEFLLLREGEETTVSVTPEKRAVPATVAEGRPLGYFADPSGRTRGLRFYGPGIVIDPKTGQPRRSDGPPNVFQYRMPQMPGLPDFQEELDQLREQIKALESQIEEMKQGRRPRRSGRNSPNSDQT